MKTKEVIHHESEGPSTDRLPSQHQINDWVGVNLGYAGSFGAAQVLNVHFSELGGRYDRRVKYDVVVQISEPGRDAEFARIYNIDSAYVLSRQEWLDWNQAKWKSGKTEDHVKLAHLTVKGDDKSAYHSVFLETKSGDVQLAGYGSDYELALNHLELQLQDYSIEVKKS